MTYDIVRHVEANEQLDGTISMAKLAHYYLGHVFGLVVTVFNVATLTCLALGIGSE